MRKFKEFIKISSTVVVSSLVVASVVFATTTVGDNVSVGGTLTVTGASTFNGAVTLGDASGDAITVTGTPTFGQDIAIGVVAINGTYFDVAATTGAVTLTQQAVGTAPLTITGIDNGTAADIDLNTHRVSGNVLDIDWTADTQTGAIAAVDIDLSNLTADGTNAVYGLHINDHVGATASTEYGAYIQGTNWDYGLYVPDDVYVGPVVKSAYDAAAYWTATQADGAAVTFDSVSDGTASFTFSDAVNVDGNVDVDGNIDVTGNLSAGASQGSMFKSTLAAGETYSGTTGHKFKVYDADNTVVHNGGEHVGVYVNMKLLSAMQAGGKSVLFSGHNYGSGGDYQAIDAGVWLYGNIVDGFKISGGESTDGIDFSEQSITGADIRMENGETIDNGTDGVIKGSGAFIGNIGSVASASALAVGGYNVINLTGTTGVTSLTGGTAGQVLTIICTEDSVTFTDDDDALDIKGDFACGDDDVLQLVLDASSKWHEISRTTDE